MPGITRVVGCNDRRSTLGTRPRSDRCSFLERQSRRERSAPCNRLGNSAMVRQEERGKNWRAVGLNKLPPPRGLREADLLYCWQRREVPHVRNNHLGPGFGQAAALPGKGTQSLGSGMGP